MQNQIPLCTLGKKGPLVSKLGLGCMGLTWAYGKTDPNESTRVLHRALELGINFLDTAELYGPYNNEEFIGHAIKSFPREKIIIATKFGFDITEDEQIIGLNSRPAHIKKSVEGSLKRLQTDYIDLYYQHRLDPSVPIEDVMQTLASLVKEGKIKYIGLSEVGPTTIRRAHKIHPLTAIQSEYSIWERSVEESVFPVLTELGIGFVPYSPLGRGFLTGKIQGIKQLDNMDWRRENYPPIFEDNIAHNLELVKKLNEISGKYGVTPAQIALLWIWQQNPNFIPIPGTKHVNYLEENVKAVNLSIPDSEWTLLNQFIQSFKPAGVRYLEPVMRLIDTD